MCIHPRALLQHPLLPRSTPLGPVFLCSCLHSIDYFLQVHRQKPQCGDSSSTTPHSLQISLSPRKRAANGDTCQDRKTMPLWRRKQNKTKQSDNSLLCFHRSLRIKVWPQSKQTNKSRKPSSTLCWNVGYVRVITEWLCWKITQIFSSILEILLRICFVSDVGNSFLAQVLSQQRQRQNQSGSCETWER